MKLDTATGPPETMEVVLRFRSEPDVPTVPSITPVPPEVVTRYQLAVPVALAELSLEIELNVSTPLEAAAAAVPTDAVTVIGYDEDGDLVEKTYDGDFPLSLGLGGAYKLVDGKRVRDTDQ